MEQNDLPKIENDDSHLEPNQAMQPLQIENQDLPLLENSEVDTDTPPNLALKTEVDAVQPTELNPVTPSQNLETSQDTQPRSISPDHDIALQGPTIEDADLVRATGEVAAANSDSQLIRAVNRLKGFFIKR